MIKKTLIVGSGFMGTSIALASKSDDISCVEKDLDYLDALKNLNLYKNLYKDINEVNEDFDLIIICSRQKQTLDHIFNFSKKFPTAVITDISSSKEFLIDKNLPRNFISSHPICGSHKTGPKNAEINLFRNKEVILIKGAKQELVDSIKQFWEFLGARTTELNLDEHNRIYAYLSHFPHYLSFIYREILEESNIDFDKYSGESLKEILRLSDSDKNLWDEIFSDNKSNIDSLKEKIKKKLS
tara:strand:- start:1654 stop:2376 length:723 start_codon:yes stop_codon:yes gene_type:complete